ncbi:MAG: hypothetical protein U0795_05395 [Pirellulales bacterium]
MCACERKWWSLRGRSLAAAWLVTAIGLSLATPAIAQTPRPAAVDDAVAKQPETAQRDADDKAAIARREAWLTKRLSGCQLIGKFSIPGHDDKLREERYVIDKVEKLPDGNLWLFQCQIKYGDHDVKVPLPLPVLWAGDTPVITLDQLTIPGLGTFDARVLIHGDKYVGTWTHGDVGGHMFGSIEPLEPAEKPAEKPADKPADTSSK